MASLYQMHALTQTITGQTTVRRDAERQKGDGEQFAASLDLWITDLRVHGCQRKPGKMLKVSTEGGQQNKFI